MLVNRRPQQRTVDVKGRTQRKRTAAMWRPETMECRWNLATCSDDRRNDRWRREVGGYRVKLISTLRRCDWGDYKNGSEVFHLLTNKYIRGMQRQPEPGAFTSEQLSATKRWVTSKLFPVCTPLQECVCHCLQSNMWSKTVSKQNKKKNCKKCMFLTYSTVQKS